MKYFRDAILGSYSQVFFTNNIWFGAVLLVASFLDPCIGLSGLICVIATILFAHVLGFNRALIQNGAYIYSSLLVGLSLAVYFQLGFAFVIILLFASFITLLLCVWMASLTSRFGLPFLSLPFVFGVWIMFFNIRGFDLSFIESRELGSCDSGWIGTSLSTLINQFEISDISSVIKGYFHAMSATVFQSNVMAGFVLSLGLLCYSRIAFTLSVLGYLSGYLFFSIVHRDLSMTEFSFGSFNYIFVAIALGGFLFVPSASSYALAFISAPLTGLMITALLKFAEPYYLPVFSLPFSLTVILIVNALNKRYFFNYLHAVQHQQFSPEKNLYAFYTYNKRFKNDTYVHVQLPFYGEWRVSQGHDGKITHKDEWQYAWDFVVTDDNSHTFKVPGKQLSDFYCYGLPVLAPAEGFVITLLDNVDDNDIGGVNINDNWGNTIIIKHTELLYSKISHIKKGSFKVKVGDYVKKGDLLALCGNSGRSPEPHIHFQLQSTSFIGAKTLKYPVSYYLTKKNGKPVLHSFEYPQQNEVIWKPVITKTLSEAFRFVPGQILEFNLSGEGVNDKIKWEVFADAYNLTYIYCHNTGSTAYFTHNEPVFYFTTFTGDKKSLLHDFYLGAHKIVLSHLPGLEINDKLPIDGNYAGPIKIAQDIIAPFYVFLKPEFHFSFAEADSVNPSRLIINTRISGGITKEFMIELDGNKIKQFNVQQKNKWLLAENIA